MIKHLILYIFLLSPASLLASELDYRTHQESELATPIEKTYGLPLKTGQIVVTESESPLAFILVLLPNIFTPFTHTGIISVEDGDVYVYQSKGDYHLSTSKPPTDTIKGYIRKTPWQEFIEEFPTVSIFMPPDSVNVNQTIKYVKHHAKIKTPFDPYFDYADESNFYCSEFVEKALQAGGNQNTPLTPFNKNYSLQQLREWNKVTPIDGIIPVGSLIDPEKWVGTYSLDLSPSELIATRGTKLEMYKRFNEKQKVGNVFIWGALGVSYRTSVEKLFQQSKRQISDKNIKGFSTSLVQEEIAKIANNLFTSPYLSKKMTCTESFYICQ